MSKPTAKSAFADFANSGLLEFPTDPSGVTVEIKRAMIKAASRVCGDVDKLELITETLVILQKHMQARFDEWHRDHPE